MRQDWIWRDPVTHERNVEVTRFARYRDVDGTQWPFQISRERNDRKVFEMFSESVNINQKIDAARFAVPGPGARPFKK